MKRSAAIIFFMVLLAGFTAASPGRARAEALPKKIPVTVTADKLDYDRATDVYIASGHVKIEQADVRLEADKVVMNNKTGEAAAEGNVYLQDKGNVVHADKLKINLNTRAGVITRGELFMKKDNYHLKGEVIERRSESVYHVEGGEFTACDERDWFIKADEMNIDMERYATGSGVSFNMGGVPVFYTPYFLFPVRRQSGFLIPEAGYSSSDGFFTDNAFFWAISDYKDLTVYSDYRTRVGHGTALEYRYNNSRDSRGQAYAKFWDMYHTASSRWDFRFQHGEEFAQDLSARADINLVSDERYYYELERTLEMRSKPYVDSNVFYVERWNTAALYLLGQYSTDLTRTNEQTVQKLPELRYTLFEEPVAGPIHLNFEGSATNFYRQESDSARRVDFNPQLTAAFGGGGLGFSPRAGLRATFYDRSAASAEPTERKYVYAGMDVNARLSRVFGSDGEAGFGRIRHSIEPTVAYTYIPHVEQGDIPLYDAVDTAAALNTTTISLINRLTAHYKASRDAPTYTTLDVMVFRLSQSYDLNVKEDIPGAARRRSDVLGELSVVTPQAFTLSANGTYNTYSEALSSHSVGVGAKVGVVSVNLTEQFIKEPATQFLIGGTGFKLGKWSLSAQWWRDMENRKTTQEEYRAHYTSQCWGIGFSYILKPGETQFVAMMDLKGIGGRQYGGQ
jgi:LPS-assembly protein